MASVIRIKRRIDDDPAEALRLSCKKQRQSGSGESDVAVDSVLSFAGTLQSKDEPVSSHIREAIRKSKVHKEMHPHSTDFKHSHHKAKATAKLREETEAVSRKNRYRVTWSRRALELSELDKEESTETSSKTDCSESTNTGLPKSQVSENDKDNEQTEDKENSAVLSECNREKDAAKDSNCTDNVQSQKVGSVSSHSSSKEINVDTSKTDNSPKSSAVQKEDKVFCILDVEDEGGEEEDLFEKAKQASRSGITLNDVPMVSTQRAPLAESEYVYDLYYTHSSLGHLGGDAVLTVETLCHDLIQEELGRVDDEDLVYDDDDDSNDEGNWRNDYPDEDPHFFENEDVDYDYSEGMLDSNVLDDGDLLSHLMSSRCRVGVESDDEEEDYEKDGESSDSDIDF